MEKTCRAYDLLRLSDGIVRVPFLVKGALVLPPEVSREQLEAAFAGLERDVLYCRLPNAQLIREPVIDREAMRYTGGYVYQVLPTVSPESLIETDIDRLSNGLYALPVDEVLDYLGRISATISENTGLVRSVRDLCRLTSELPDSLLDAWFAALCFMFDRDAARSMIDNELSVWGTPGSRFLEGWVEAPSRRLPGLNALLAPGRNVSAPPEQPATRIRAMPTRQLHIAAGNSPEIPVICALRAILTKSAGVVKCPRGTTLSASLFALAAAVAAPDHPITRNLSLVYWEGGEESVESALFWPNAFDRMVVWGTADTVASVQSSAPFTRTVCFNPRYGVSLIGREAFTSDIEQVAALACADSLVHNQKSCAASLVHYVEGTQEQAEKYAGAVRRALEKWDAAMPQFVAPSVRGQIKRLKRGKYNAAGWYLNGGEDDFRSGVALMEGEFDLLDHPMCRLVVVRRVDDLTDALRYMHQGVSAVGMYPEERRLALRDRIAAKGVSSVLPLGQCERVYPGMPHDGMMVLSHLVDWKNG